MTLGIDLNFIIITHCESCAAELSSLLFGNNDFENVSINKTHVFTIKGISKIRYPAIAEYLKCNLQHKLCHNTNIHLYGKGGVMWDVYINPPYEPTQNATHIEFGLTVINPATPSGKA